MDDTRSPGSLEDANGNGGNDGYGFTDFVIDVVSVALTAVDFILGGPTGEGIAPALAIQSLKTTTKKVVTSGVKLTRGGKRKIGNLQDLKDMRADEAIRLRGGGKSQVDQLSTDLKEKTVGEIANMAATKDPAAETAMKMIKQASSKAGKYCGK
ncbi:hypothetical protein [Desulfopila sp. IMCC35008]|uniref:hypothetical protein n=1 Tax=Desulfopila sp. IMCC35008 TaxID=2653858 RepID=UPI001F0F6376|nr:hypothetical protein [Desulfopila sp. IMCC35008]